MFTLRAAAAVLFLCTLGDTLLAADHIIAIEPYPAEKDFVTGQPKVWGQKIVLRGFDVQLEDFIVQVPILSIQYEGLHHTLGEGKNRVEARAKCIAERLSVAWQLLNDGGRLEIHADDWNDWRLAQQDAPPPAPAIFVTSPALGRTALRVMTIYPQDVSGYPRGETQIRLAKYIVALLEACHLLFEKKSTDIRKYEALAVDQTREGKIFKEIFIRADEVMKLKGLKSMTDEILRDALARIALPQRQRLVNMAFKVPLDWRDVKR